MDIDKHFEIIEKIVTFSEPLQKILNDVWDPYTTIIIEHDRVRVGRDEISIPLNEGGTYGNAF